MTRTEEQLATFILKNFNKHYARFMALSKKAKLCFEGGLWEQATNNRIIRLGIYDQRVQKTVEKIREKHPNPDPDKALWMRVRSKYHTLLAFHPQAELAETFYNSVFCNLFSFHYYRNEFIFVESVLSSQRLPTPKESVYLSYYPAVLGIKQTLQEIFHSFAFSIPFENMHRDIRLLVKQYSKSMNHGRDTFQRMRIDIIKHVFYKNKRAYVIGRSVTSHSQPPFVLVLCQENGRIRTDALIFDHKSLSIIFGFYRAYYMVSTNTPSALVHCLLELMPEKTIADLYSIIGLHKQGKTEFYRILLHTMDKSHVAFQEAEGIAGLVMFVFTLPNFPYVFKIIRDNFGYNKNFSRQTVKDRFYLVKQHDRVGRMADILEYTDVALPLHLFSKPLLASMLAELKKSVYVDDDKLVIQHMYIERKMIPLNLFLDHANDEEQRQMIDEYGKSIKDMISVNIFPGDMLFKNFGVTSYKRVVFYDYDEVQYLTDMNIRKLPTPMTFEQEMASEPWYTVMPNDFFPEEIQTFVTTKPAYRKLLQKLHPELLTVKYWQSVQQKVHQKQTADIIPYDEQRRLEQLFPEEYGDESSK